MALVSDMLVWGATLGAGLFASMASAVTARRLARGPLLSRVSELEENVARVEASARRREMDEATRHARREKRLRSALGLPDGLDAPRLAGRALAESVVERLRGLASLDACVVTDDLGLSWTTEDVAESVGLAAIGGAVLGADLRGVRPRSMHIELDDARHVVVRPITGTMPALALATLSTSRPVGPFALDAVTAHASLLLAAEDVESETCPLTGWPVRISRQDAPILMKLSRELEEECQPAGAGMLAVLVGDEVIAAYGADGPREEEIAAFASKVRGVLSRVELRMGSRARRVDWVGPAGATLSLAPLGGTGRTSVLVIRREGPVQSATFDRLTGRLRRLLPAESPPAAREARA